MNSPFPKIWIVILNWNGKEDTCECLSSIKKVKYPNYEVIVVDNASDDNSVMTFKDTFPDITIIETGANLGYAGGNNAGIQYALSKGAKYVLILNNDTIVDSFILDHLLKASQEYPEAGILGPKIYYHAEPEKIWFAGGKWMAETALTQHIGIGCLEDSKTWSQIKSVDYICGCALLVKSEVFNKIGLFDTRFFLTWEETDFCYKARLSGFECLFVPTAMLWHKISASFKGRSGGGLYGYFFQRNRLLWIENNLPMSLKIKIYLKMFHSEILPRIKGYLNPKAEYRQECKIYLVACRDYLLRRFGNCPSWIRSS